MASRFRFGQVVWCDFSEAHCPFAGNNGAAKCGHLPEFVGKHPAIIVSTGNRDGLPYFVVPMTSQPPRQQDEGTIKLSPSPVDASRDSYIVAGHIYSMSAERLTPIYRNRKALKLEHGTLQTVIQAMHKRLPQPTK